MYIYIYRERERQRFHIIAIIYYAIDTTAEYRYHSYNMLLLDTTVY